MDTTALARYFEYLAGLPEERLTCFIDVLQLCVSAFEYRPLAVAIDSKSATLSCDANAHADEDICGIGNFNSVTDFLEIADSQRPPLGNHHSFHAFHYINHVQPGHQLHYHHHHQQQRLSRKFSCDSSSYRSSLAFNVEDGCGAGDSTCMSSSLVEFVDDVGSSADALRVCVNCNDCCCYCCGLSMIGCNSGNNASPLMRNVGRSSTLGTDMPSSIVKERPKKDDCAMNDNSGVIRWRSNEQLALPSSVSATQLHSVSNTGNTASLLTLRSSYGRPASSAAKNNNNITFAESTQRQSATFTMKSKDASLWVWK